MFNNFILPIVCLSSLIAFQVLADDPGGNTLYTRIIDSGAGLCTVTRFPGSHYMVYDTGHWNGQKTCDAGIKRVVSAGHVIDLLVLSHSDADHVSATDEILDAYEVKTVVRTGDVRWDKANWRNAYWSIRRRREAGELKDINLWNLPGGMLAPGWIMSFDASDVMFVAGFNDPPREWGIPIYSQSKNNNAISIVVKASFAGRSILFVGDAVGRTNDGSKDCWATEKFMVENSGTVPINAEVLIAPHHGANNASSDCFIEKVNPTWVVFSAGHDHAHPRAEAVQRYLDHDVSVENIFRTDLGDNEGGKEWSHGNTSQEDGIGDDDVEIIIESSGSVTVQYVN